MANDRLFRALDQLAGVASEEIEKGRELALQQQLRMEAINRLNAENDRRFQMEQARLNIQKEQLEVSKSQFKQRETRFAEESKRDAEIRKRQDDISRQVAQLKFQNELTRYRTNQYAMLSEQYKELSDTATSEELIPMVQAMRVLETDLFKRPLTPLPRAPKTPEPDIPQTDAEQQPTGPSLFQQALDFFTKRPEGEEEQPQDEEEREADQRRRVMGIGLGKRGSDILKGLGLMEPGLSQRSFPVNR